jgi:threonine dehydratase
VKPSIADGLTGNLDPDTITFDVVRRLVSRIEVVDEAALSSALRDVVLNDHLIVEGAAAVGAAALLEGRVDVAGQRAAVILTGANIDRERLAAAIEDGHDLTQRPRRGRGRSRSHAEDAKEQRAVTPSRRGRRGAEGGHE